MVSDAHLTGAKDSVTTSSVALVLTTAIAAAQRDRGLADDAEDGLETLPPAYALKSGGDAGEGTRWISSPKALQWCSRQTHFLIGPKSGSMRLNA